MLKQVYNPDVLTCLANLSSDEVFTPPTVVNQMLDSLPKELWSDEKVTFLDPVSKSGVFLREITKRLIDGLESKIPNLEERIEHILRNQVFGIGITELTSLISRRSLYCSKYANRKYSIVQFDDEQGNLKHFEAEHKWEGGICKYCGVSKEMYDRGDKLENYAYSFIHTDNPEKFFNMKFDVIIGNPPYQMDDGGFGKSSKPLYHRFVQFSKKLNPRFFSFIIPARWYNGGKGLDDFREEMISDKRISQLHDFQDTNDVFPGLNIRGGICYFLWERDYNGECLVTNHRGKTSNIPSSRFLKEENLEILIRHNESISILNKVRLFNESSFSEIVSSRKPFGLPTNFRGFSKNKTTTNNILLYRFGDNGYISSEDIVRNPHFSKEYKVLVPKASPGDDSYPHLILSKPIISEPRSVCTETYIMIGPFSNRKRCVNVGNYMMSSFFRFMVLLSKSTQDVTKKTYSLVPNQNFDENWDDEKLYNKYSLSVKEIEFIDSLIRKSDVKYE